MKKMEFNTDRIIGLSAMLISLLTLIIFVYQTNLIRTQSRLSVTPRVSFYSSLDSKDSMSTFTYFITNKGLGPAIVESINILHKDNSYKLNFPIFFDEVYPKFRDYGKIVQNMSINEGTTLSEKESFKFLTFSFKRKDTAAFFEYLEVDGDRIPFDIEVVYSSIYGEQWKFNSNHIGHPIKL